MAKKRILDRIQQAPTLLEGRSVFVGNLHGKKDFFVRGKVLGDCDIQGMVLLSPDSYWLGNIVADNVIINGTVEGDVTARVSLEVRGAARIQGNLTSPSIAISQTARINGALSHNRNLTRFSERRLRTAHQSR